MNGSWENDKFFDQNVFSLDDDEIQNSIFSTQCTSLNSFGFPTPNEPVHPIQQTEESIKEDVECLISSLIDEADITDLPNLELPPNNLQNSMTAQSNLAPPNSENELTLAAYLPISILTQIDVDALYERIMNMIDEFPDDEWRPKLISSVYEAGYWIVKLANELSKRWFVEKVSAIPLQLGDGYIRLNIVPIKNLPSYKSEVVIKGQIASDDKILSRFARQNKEIELTTSRWSDLKCTPKGFNKYTLNLDIDLLSYEKIKANEFELFFEMEKVKFKIYDKLEVAAMDIISMEEGMND